MSARSVVSALDGRWLGDYGMAKCPVHDDRRPSLSVRRASDGRLLVCCHAGCDQGDVITALRKRGLWMTHHDHGLGNGAQERPPATIDSASQGSDDHRRAEIARTLWRASKLAPETLVEIYLRTRGITIGPPPTLRYHSRLIHSPSGLNLPAMVAAVQGPDGRVSAAHRTYLRIDGRGKAPVKPPRMMLGPVKGCAVRLGPAGPCLAIAEGIETGLSIAQACRNVPVWCALSVSNFRAIVLPPVVREVVLCTDGDAPGSQAAEAVQQAAARLAESGRLVSIARPPDNLDFNDVLRTAGAA